MKSFLVYSEFYSIVVFLLSCVDVVKFFSPLLEHGFFYVHWCCGFCIDMQANKEYLKHQIKKNLVFSHGCNENICRWKVFFYLFYCLCNTPECLHREYRVNQEGRFKILFFVNVFSSVHRQLSSRQLSPDSWASSIELPIVEPTDSWAYRQLSSRQLSPRQLSLFSINITK